MAEMTKLEKFFVNNPVFNWINKKRLMRKFFSFIDHDVQGKVLEIGCGIGSTTSAIYDEYQGIEITGVDYDKDQIDSAKKRESENIHFEQGDGSNLRFDDETFDYVFQENSFHHIEDYKSAIKETYRVLKSRGYFFVMDMEKKPFKLWPFSIIFSEHSPFTKESFEKDLRKAGFTIVKSKKNRIFFIKAKKK